MSDHKTAFVPIESWCYNSPELRASGKTIDVGLLAESLIYYDRVIINITNQPQFAELLNWFVKQNKYNEFLALIDYGIIKIYEYAFITSAIEKEGVYSLLNIQDSIQEKPNTFEQRFLYHESISACLDNSRKRKKLYQALRENIIEVKASDFGNPVENARNDWENPRRNSLLVQAFIDELFKFKNLGTPPEVKSEIDVLDGGGRKNLSWNINFDELSRLAGGNLNFHRGTAITAGAISNRFIWSAATLGCDLYLGQPIATLVGDKLYESGTKLDKSKSIIEDLKGKVEFPDIRRLVNEGVIGFDEIMAIRDKASKFRNWLQDEGDRDRDAIIAYHNEVAKESGITKLTRKTLSIFGVVGGGATGAAIGAALTGPVGGAIGGAAGSSVGYVMDVASKLGSDWKPVVFGNWMRNRIEKAIDSNT